MKTKILSILFALALIGCSKAPAPKEISRFSVGKITDVDITTGHYRSYTAIKTEKECISFQGIIRIVPIGKEAYIINLSDDRQAFTWDGSFVFYFIE